MAATLAPQQKAAALVLAIGTDKAESILQHLTRDEIEALANHVLTLGEIDPNERRGVVRDVLSHLLTIDPLAEAEALRTRAKTALPASQKIDKGPDGPFGFLARVEIDQLVQYLANEHPQTIAVVLSHQPPEVSAKILNHIDEHLAADVAMRIATIGKTPPELIVRIVEAMKAELTETHPEDAAPPEGARELAGILNRGGHELEEWVLERLGMEDRQLADRVKALMFTFADIVTLDDRSIQKVLQNVETASLALALKGQSDDVQDAIYRNLSERASESLREEAELLGTVRRTEVEEAQMSVVAQIRALEAAGQITISRGGDGDFIE